MTDAGPIPRRPCRRREQFPRRSRALWIARRRQRVKREPAYKRVDPEMMTRGRPETSKGGLAGHVLRCPAASLISANLTVARFWRAADRHRAIGCAALA